MPHILIVDDHPAIRRLLVATLDKRYTIAEAQDGTTALDAIRRDPPKLVLLDVMMPGDMDGLQLLEAIKGNPDTQGILVAMLSARGQAADQAEASQLGADAYFVKPFSPLQIVAWVRSKLD